jgi:hypothetical protein
LIQGCHHIGDGAMIPSAAIDVSPHKASIGVDDDDATLLPGISLGGALAVTGGQRSLRPTDGRDAQSYIAMEAGQLVAASLGIGEHRKGHREVLDEVLGHQRRAIADGEQTGAGRFDGSVMFGETSDLLAAEKSAIVAKKDQYCWAVLPQRRERMNGSIERENGGLLKR